MEHAEVIEGTPFSAVKLRVRVPGDGATAPQAFLYLRAVSRCLLWYDRRYDLGK